MDRSRSLLTLLSLSLLLASSANPNPNPNRSRAYHRAPSRFAADLIRDLNLFPGLQQGSDGTPNEIEDGPRLVEKKLNLEVLGDIGSNVSVEELGHHAGYYRLEHTHAAKMFYFFFESRGSSSDPVVLWLTGGPHHLRPPEPPPVVSPVPSPPVYLPPPMTSTPSPSSQRWPGRPHSNACHLFDETPHRNFYVLGYISKLPALSKGATVHDDMALEKALGAWDLQVIPFNSPVAEASNYDPELEMAFIRHLHGHWFCVRKVNGEWYSSNSLYAAPEHLSKFHLSASLDTLRGSGWSIFLVRGNFPKDWPIPSSNTFGQWLTPDDAERITKSCNEMETRPERQEPSRAAYSDQFMNEADARAAQEERDLNAAIAASLMDSPTFTLEQASFPVPVLHHAHLQLVQIQLQWLLACWPPLSAKALSLSQIRIRVGSHGHGELQRRLPPIFAAIFAFILVLTTTGWATLTLTRAVFA